MPAERLPMRQVREVPRQIYPSAGESGLPAFPRYCNRRRIWCNESRFLLRLSIPACLTWAAVLMPAGVVLLGQVAAPVNPRPRFTVVGQEKRRLVVSRERNVT